MPSLPTFVASQAREPDRSERPYATFHGYLDVASEDGCIDFVLRLVRGPGGERDFYIRPANVDGITGDFTVVGNVVLPIDDGHAAGSRPLKPHDWFNFHGRKCCRSCGNERDVLVSERRAA